MLSSGAVLTYSIEYSLDNAQDPMNLTQQFTLSRTTTVLTITKTAHGLAVGDWVKLWGNGGANLDAEFNVATVVDADNVTVAIANSGLTAGNGTGWMQTLRVLPLTAPTGNTVDGSYGLDHVVTAVRINVSSWTSGTVDFQVLQGRG
tara:strand:- start:3824 stop:4264 length:441 start_codon:yes stop_codon:yes gene_type:complete